MKDSRIAARGIVLLGCGKMGSAMLRGWLARGLPAISVWVVDPAPSDWVQSTGVHVNAPLPAAPAVVLIAVKPQMMADALPDISDLGDAETVFVSIAAGTPIAAFEAALGNRAIVRAMPNTPAAIGQGITALCGNAAGMPFLDEVAAVLSAIGTVVRLEDEAQMDAVTGVSGSGPAYVFHLIETLAAAGVAQGVKDEAETAVRQRVERLLSDMDLVTREEFEAVREMAQKAREENEDLKARIEALEGKA